MHESLQIVLVFWACYTQSVSINVKFLQKKTTKYYELVAGVSHIDGNQSWLLEVVIVEIARRRWLSQELTTRVIVEVGGRWVEIMETLEGERVDYFNPWIVCNKARG